MAKKIWGRFFGPKSTELDIERIVHSYSLTKAALLHKENVSNGSIEKDYWICDERHCKWTGPKSELLKAPDPFNAWCTLTACPNCREQNLIAKCDEKGCGEPASCGTPIVPGLSAGYRHTCYRHIPKT